MYRERFLRVGGTFTETPKTIKTRDSTGETPTCLRRQVGFVPAASRGLPNNKSLKIHREDLHSE